MLVVIHTFHAFNDDIEIPLQGQTKIIKMFAREGIHAVNTENCLTVNGASAFDGVAILLKVCQSASAND
jgi:hypothetical protein